MNIEPSMGPGDGDVESVRTTNKKGSARRNDSPSSSVEVPDREGVWARPREVLCTKLYIPLIEVAYWVY